MTDAKQTCGNCRFYTANDGVCRRYPPLHTFFIISHPDRIWCGEWQAKPVEQSVKQSVERPDDDGRC